MLNVQLALANLLVTLVSQEILLIAAVPADSTLKILAYVQVYFIIMQSSLRC